MAEKLVGACVIGQSGGPTAVINASAYGAITAALKAEEITQVLGADHGITGVLGDKLYDMGKEDPQELAYLKNTPASELGSCRYKLADPEKDDRCSKSTTSAISSIMAATTPWTPATRSAALCPSPAGIAG